ncbi:MAG: TPM domain-containing protein [Bacteroidetes bacterium]|nr:TPM domain-containing protein [Bacteroidota bacterium]MBU1678082.1 TPM domain-containing protein [Bacteroidota bacterium]MBU2507116.1 TPM domain-containing protein [Bacteroidota bacterium]
MKKSIYIVVLFLISGFLLAQPRIPNLKNYATDLTGTLNSSELNQINQELTRFDEATSTQIVLLMIPSLEGYPLEMLSHEIAEKNKIGTKENSNGILFLVVKNDRKMRIEVGYGLEGALPDALASSILRNDVAQHFKKDQYLGGIIAGLNSIVSAVKGEYKQEKKKRKDNDGGGFPFIYIIIIIIISFFSRGKRGGLGTLLLLGALSGGRSRGGGSFGGGGFGGFSGGGSFGGGGSSGSW